MYKKSGTGKTTFIRLSSIPPFLKWTTKMVSPLFFVKIQLNEFSSVKLLNMGKIVQIR
jgi:hypothetical protein